MFFSVVSCTEKIPSNSPLPKGRAFLALADITEQLASLY